MLDYNHNLPETNDCVGFSTYSQVLHTYGKWCLNASSGVSQLCSPQMLWLDICFMPNKDDDRVGNSRNHLMVCVDVL